MNQFRILLLGAVLAQAQAQAPAAKPSPEGRLGGGYKNAKWGMSLAEVKSQLPGRLEYETRQPKPERTLILDLGSGRKLTCLFENDRFFQAIYQPIAADGDQTGAEAVLEGLASKYGPGKEIEGFTDNDGRPLRLVTWNDGVTKIEFRMRDPRAAEKAPERKPQPPAPGLPPAAAPALAAPAAPYPSATVAVLYTGIVLNAKRSHRQEEEKRRAEEQKRQQRARDIQGDL